MEHNIINTGAYLLIVDESEIKEGDWWFDIEDKRVFNVTKEDVLTTKDDIPYGFKKIIAHLPLNNSPILEGVDLLPPLEDEVDKFESFLDREIELGLNTKETIDRIKWYYQQYFKSKQKHYTEEDLMKAIDMSREYTPDVTGFTKDEIIQSIQQTNISIGFMCEVEYVGGDIEESEDYDERDWEQKTITNSQGITQWVGEYIHQLKINKTNKYEN